jgi:predicted secreted protein
VTISEHGVQKFFRTACGEDSDKVWRSRLERLGMTKVEYNGDSGRLPTQTVETQTVRLILR